MLRDHDECDCKGQPCPEHGDPDNNIGGILLFGILIAVFVWIEFF